MTPFYPILSIILLALLMAGSTGTAEAKRLASAGLPDELTVPIEVGQAGSDGLARGKEDKKDKRDSGASSNEVVEEEGEMAKRKMAKKDDTFQVDSDNEGDAAGKKKNGEKDIMCVDNLPALSNAVAKAPNATEEPGVIYLCPNVVYIFTEPIDVSGKAIRLRCLSNAPDDCVLNGNDISQIFINTNNAEYNLKFEDITVIKGRGQDGGAVQLFGAAASVVSFDNCVFTNNKTVSVPSTSKNQDSGSFTIAENQFCLH
jgi:hypothetical protein